MNNPLVSIVIPCYNVENYVKECLDSVINQTYKNIEIVCVDDGSSDNTLRILRKYRETDDRIIIVSQSNRGQATARNIGTEISCGKYIMYVDSDDYIDRTIVEYCVDNMKNHNAKLMIFSGIAFLDGKGIPTENIDEMTNFLTIDNAVETIEPEKCLDIPKSPCCRMIDLEWMRSKEIDFPEGLLYEDIYFAWSIYFERPYTVFDSKRGYYYRIRNNSTMTSSMTDKSFTKAINHLKNWEKLLHRLYKNGTLIENYLIMHRLLKLYGWNTRQYSKPEDRQKELDLELELENKLRLLSSRVI